MAVKQIQIVVNGQTLSVSEGTTISGLLVLSNFTGKAVAVELNTQIRNRATFGTTALSQGDTVEIVSLAGGG